MSYCRFFSTLSVVPGRGGVVFLCQASVLTPQKCELWAKYSSVPLNLVHIFAKLKAA